MGAVKELLVFEAEYLLENGGFENIKEMDQTINENNRKLVKACHKKHGQAWLGNFMLHDRKLRPLAASGEVPVLVPYKGQEIENFSYSFCVPCFDQKLEDLLKELNRKGETNLSPKIINKITRQVYALGGFFMVWM